MKKKKFPSHPMPKASPFPQETIEISNRHELLLGGVLGIEEYRTESVRVKTEKGAVSVCGVSLSLCWAGEKRLLLRGHIESLRFENRPPQKGGYRSCP
ncbi:MAG: YabP/YqfC family sporulation protein [Clostridia bacterium]|nr:YabP/YqfC family sporulation protein [Clostridia bacterium]